jgi:hypothetical protein
MVLSLSKVSDRKAKSLIIHEVYHLPRENLKDGEAARRRLRGWKLVDRSGLQK